MWVCNGRVGTLKLSFRPGSSLGSLPCLGSLLDSESECVSEEGVVCIVGDVVFLAPGYKVGLGTTVEV